MMSEVMVFCTDESKAMNKKETTPNQKSVLSL